MKHKTRKILDRQTYQPRWTIKILDPDPDPDSGTLDPGWSPPKSKRLFLAPCIMPPKNRIFIEYFKNLDPDRDPHRHQNLIDCLWATPHPPKISSKSAHNLLRCTANVGLTLRPSANGKESWKMIQDLQKNHDPLQKLIDLSLAHMHSFLKKIRS